MFVISLSLKPEGTWITWKTTVVDIMDCFPKVSDKLLLPISLVRMDLQENETGKIEQS